MNKPDHPIPTEINLHKKSHMLVVVFSDGKRFELPCEYLRINSHAAEVQTMAQPVTGKEEVNIESIEPQGNYAIRLVFNDGHDTGIYSWETLYELGDNYATNWANYLERLKMIGYERDRGDVEGKENIELNVLYFSYLVPKLRKESEKIIVPVSISDVASLMAWLRKKWRDKGYLLNDDNIRVTVNRQFAEPFTRIESGDEIAVTPNSPTPPPAPKKATETIS